MQLLQRGVSAGTVGSAATSLRFKSLNAVTAVTVGTAAALPNYGTTGIAPELTWEVVLSGTAAASIQIDLQGSMDNVNWYQLDTTSVTASGIYHIADKKVLFVRANLIAIGTPNGTYTVFIDVA